MVKPPSIPLPNPDLIPSELKAQRLWCCGKLEVDRDKNGAVKYEIDGSPKWRKISLLPGGAWGRANHPEELGTFDEAFARAQKAGGRLAVVFLLHGDQFTVVDLDNAIDSQGVIRPWAAPILEKGLASGALIERTASRRGFHLWFRGAWRGEPSYEIVPRLGAEKAQQIEAWSTARFVWSGEIETPAPTELADGLAFQSWLIDEHRPRILPAKPKREPLRRQVDVDDIKRAAMGRWEELFLRVGGFEAPAKNGSPCPKCGGDDRFFRHTGFDETGAIGCRKCHDSPGGDGLEAIRWFTGWDFPTVLSRVAEHLGLSYAPRQSNRQRDSGEEIAPRPRVDSSARKVRELLPWKPFPLDALPAPLRDLAEVGAESIGCDPVMVALPGLVAAAAAVGTSVQLKIMDSWSVRSILWGAVSARTGSKKSPALALATKPLERINRDLAKTNQEAKESYESEKAEYEAARKSRKKDAPSLGAPPKEPRPTLLKVSDSTPAGVVSALAGSPKGLAVVADELRSWFCGFDRFSSGKGGAEEPFWLSAYDGRPHDENRRGQGHIRVASLSVSIVGGVQPQILARTLGADQIASGLAGRLLIVEPPNRVSQLSVSQLSCRGGTNETEDAWAECVEGLWSLPCELNEWGEPDPLVLRLSEEAKRHFVDFYNSHNRGLDAIDDEAVRASWAKLEEIPARLALVMHCCDWAMGLRDCLPDEEVSGDTIRRAILLAEWFKHEAQRVWGVINGDSDARAAADLAGRLRGKGPITARDLHRMQNKRYPSADDAEAALNDLERRGLGRWGEWEGSERGGPRTRRFHLAEVPNDTTDETSGIPGDDEVVSPEPPSDAPSGARVRRRYGGET